MANSLGARYYTEWIKQLRQLDLINFSMENGVFSVFIYIVQVEILYCVFLLTCCAEWADKLTEMGRGKHHIGDFLPPEELEKFMETYSVSVCLFCMWGRLTQQMYCWWVCYF